MKEEIKLTEYIKPLFVKGQDVKRKFSSADVDVFRKKFDFKDEFDNITESIDLRQPLRIEFMGYDGFLTLKDIEDTEEGKETFGITDSTRVREMGSKVQKEGINKKYD